MEDEAEGILTINHPWPSIARTIYGDHQRYKEVYFSAFEGRYFPGDGALRDADGNYRITGRVDDVVIVSVTTWGLHPLRMQLMRILPWSKVLWWVIPMMSKEMP